MFADNEQGVPLEAFQEGRDVYIIYSFEDVAFHWKSATGAVSRRFRGTGNESETDQRNRLFNDAQMGGRRATKAEYDAW